MKIRTLGVTIVLAFLTAVLPTPAAAQGTVELNPRAGELTRDELTHLLERLEAASGSTGYSRDLRNQAAREAQFVRDRLQQGDFQVGDRVVLTVAGEPQLSDTLAVNGRRALELAQIGEISLRGVLRSELERHLTDELSRYLREPQVYAQALVRIAVLGSVGAPGFYTMPGSVLIEDALMAAGGPRGAPEISEIRIERGQNVIWEGDLLQRAIAGGRTLDQLSLQAGDRIIVPERNPGLFEGGVLRTLLVTLPPLIYLITRLAG